MFGVGIFEVLIILIVAIIALGPNKLPQTIVEIVKFFRAVRKTMSEAKETFDKEIQLSEIKQEALKYKDAVSKEVDKITKDIKLDELRELSVESIAKPLEESKQAIKEQSESLNSAIQSLNEEISYDKRNTDSVENHKENPIADNANAEPKTQDKDSKNTISDAKGL